MTLSAHFPLTSPARNLDPAHQRTRLLGVSTAEPVLAGMLRLRRLFKIFDAIVRRVFVDVMDYVALAYRIIWMVRVPHVLVALYVSVLTNGWMQMPLVLRHADEDASFVAHPSTPTPVGVGLRSGGLGDLGLNSFRHTARRLVGACPGAMNGSFVGRVSSRELHSTNRAFLRRSHNSNGIGQSERGRSKSLGQRQ